MSIAIGKNQIVFVVPEVAANFDANGERLIVGTTVTASEANNYIPSPATPAADNDDKAYMFLTSGEGQINQELELLDDKQLRNGRSKKTPIAGRLNPGKYSFPTYIKTAPNNATAIGYKCASLSAAHMALPEVDTLLEAAIGAKSMTGTFAAGVSSVTKIKYEPNNLKQKTFTLYLKKDHSVFCGVGATVNTLKIDVKGSDVANYSFDGEFMKMYKAGTATLAAAATALDTTVTLAAGTAERFDVGMPIEFVTAAGVRQNNTKAGWRVLSISGDVITLSEAVGVDLAIGDTIRGYIPYSDDAEYTERGIPLHGKSGKLRFRVTGAAGATTDLTVLDASITINNNIKYSNDEKNGSMVAKDFFNSDFRVLDGTLSLYFREKDIKFFNDAINQNKYELFIPVGSVDEVQLGTDGTIQKLAANGGGLGVVVKLPHIEVKSPMMAGENEITMTVNFSALSTPTANDDEISIQYV